MKLKIQKFIKSYGFVILSILVFTLLIVSLILKLCSNSNFSKSLVESRADIIAVSGLLAGLIIAYLTAKVLQVRQEKIAKLPELTEQTQRLHKVRSIIDKLIHSDIWPEGVRHFVDKDFSKLSYYQIEEMGFVGVTPTEIAKKFVEDKRYGGIPSLYLQLKSFVSQRRVFDYTLYTEFDVPVFYKTETIQRWIDYTCGNGLWYYFEHKYSIYKDRLLLDNIYAGDSKEILEKCLQIDKERYKDLEFGPELLAKLGTQLTEDILPSLLRIQRTTDSELPRIIKYLFFISGTLIVFGVGLPIINRIYELSPLLDIISISITISISLYLLLSFYGFMNREIRL